MRLKKTLGYFSKFEWSLWGISTVIVILSYIVSKDYYPLTLIASLLGVTALIFLAKGNVIGQFLTVLFSILYGIISFRFRYYGEMITYLCMSAPSAAVACVSWLKNPSDKGRSEVKISTLTKRKFIYLSFSAVAVTFVFYFILRYFDTENLLISTLSVTTSFFASMLLIFRSPFYAVAYAANDVVLITLWILASISQLSYLPMVFCFSAFFFNDLYAFINWKRMHKRQSSL